MSTERLVLSDKYKAFLRCDAPAEFLEGTTAAGKTTVGLFKFMLKVAESPKKLHILAFKTCRRRIHSPYDFFLFESYKHHSHRCADYRYCEIRVKSKHI